MESKSANYELQLDSLFVGDVSQLKTKNLLHNAALSGSVFADNNNFKYAIFTTSLELVEKFKEARQYAIINLINALIMDGAKSLATIRKRSKRAFHFSSIKGKFSNEVSFII